MIDQLMTWLDKSTCNFTAVKNIKAELDKAGFKELNPADAWLLEPNHKYYMVKNDSAIFPFITGTAPIAESGFRIIAAHSDSPCFKIKPNPEIYGDGGVISLNVEKYGGGIMYTWFDRELSIAGRIMLQTGDVMNPQCRIVDLKRPVATIPHLAIHFNRQVNEGNPLSVQKDMKPVIGRFTAEEIENFKKHGGAVKSMIAEAAGVAPEDIIGYELCLYPVEKSNRAGVHGEYLMSGRIDDLSMAYAGLRALLDECDNPTPQCRILAIFDNEETGSATRQGAAAPTLRHIMQRICGESSEDLTRALARTFLISADDAHAWHPNYNEKYDPTNHPVIGGGPAIKINANCKYMTDSRGAAIFESLCRKAGVKCQYFVNHADVAGGSTLGNILTSQLDIDGVDIGAPIWGMHSARETAGVYDHQATIAAFKVFYS